MDAIKKFYNDHKTEIIVSVAIVATATVTASLTASKSAAGLRNLLREMPISVQIDSSFFENAEFIPNTTS